MSKPVLWIVIPCYNEEQVLPITAPMFLEKIHSLTAQGLVSDKSRVLFVNDGSRDKTWELIQGFAAQDEHYIGISQSRNRGHQNAVLAGLMEALHSDSCDITISIDCDGQDDINAMDEMVKKYLDGAEVVYGVRSKRDTDTFFKRFTAESFYKLLNATGEFSHLLVWKIDRISRNLLDFSVMYAELKELGVVFVSKNEQFDTSSAMGEAMLKIILIFAELERKTTSERVSAVFVSRANDGIWNGGKVPYGYSYDKEGKTFSIAEDEAKIVRLIYSLYESEKSIVRVARIMNERGLKSRAGSDWSPTTVHTILSSPFYSGTYRYNYRNESNRKRFREKGKDEWVLVENHHPAIVSPERQAAVGVILESKRYNKNATYQRKNVHVFAGLPTCGCCGSTMAATTDKVRADGWRPSMYICSRRRKSEAAPCRRTERRTHSMS